MGKQSRRQLLRALGGLGAAGLLAACALPFVSAPQPARVPRIGLLVPGTSASSSPSREAFLEGLRGLGYVEGGNVALEVRFAEGRQERLPELAAELVRLEVDVILTNSTPGIRAAQQATSTIPIVFATAGDPVSSGLVTSLARPGGNVTGLTVLSEISPKRLELLKEAVPGLSRVAALWTPTSAGSFRETQAAGQALGVQVLSLELRSPDDLDTVLAAASGGRADGLILMPDAVFPPLRTQIVEFAAMNRLPAMYPQSGDVVAGGLMAYGPNIPANFRRAAAYVDKILKGAKPAELPVERPREFEFVINLKTARALGLAIPPIVLMQATEIIE